MPKEHELSDFQKGQILALEPHFNHTEIGHQLAIPRTTIINFLHRYHERQSIENVHRLGAPRKTSKTTDHYIIRTAKLNPRLPFNDLTNIINAGVSSQTIRRRLREDGIRKWHAVGRPLLTSVRAKKRLEWAMAHRHWTIEDWRKVIWSDECKVQKDPSGNVIWIFRHQNIMEKYAPQNVQGKRNYTEASQMVWACFCNNKLGPIIFLEGMVNQDVYQQMLDQNLLPFVEALNADGQSDLLFQQDNAPVHTAKRTKAWLEEAAKQHNLKILEWPPYSPDMNLIENLWAHLKSELHKQSSSALIIQQSNTTVKDVLRQQLHKVWWNIQEGILEQLVESMPDRVAALIEAKGWYTRF